MCGICGVIGNVGFSSIDTMAKRLFHRGPDDFGLWSEDNVYLGHTRLAVIDTTDLGHQPMSNEDRNIWLVFNGEIYNFLDLRKELELCGHRFMSNTDTEVIIHLYEEYDVNCLKYLRGMFAFAIWDKTRQRLFAARDRFGIKPFYYYFKNGEFIFSSELSPLLASGYIQSELDVESVRDYFITGSVRSPYTLYKDILQLLPAHYLIFKDSKLLIKNYWKVSFSDNTTDLKLKEDEIVSDIRDTLNESVKIRLISDVPLGIFLSGGIDSSIIAALAKINSSSSVKTFNICFEDSIYDERQYADRISKLYDTEHKTLLITEKEAIQLLPKFFDSLDQPSIDGFNTFVISKLVRTEGIKVALSGLGGDELFCGYPVFLNLPRMIKILRFSGYLPSFSKDVFWVRLHKTIKKRNILKFAFSLLTSNRNLYDLYVLNRCVFLPVEAEELFSFEFNRPRSGVLRNDFDLKKSCTFSTFLVDYFECKDHINLLSYFEICNYLQNMLLQDTDRMSMANSLEVRVPFLDHRLVEMMFRIPGYLKIDKDYPKRLLVKAFIDLIPEEIYRRPKKGFVFPFDRWFRSGLRDYCEAIFSLQNLKKIPILNTKKIQSIWESFLNKSGPYNSSSIFSILSFINWYDKNA